jgi:nucleotide-binding universal stress UspA family protein
MTPLRRILVATDFSSDAGCALARAQLIAAEHRAELALVHVINASALDAFKAVFRDTPTIERELFMATQRALDELAATLAQKDVAVTTSLRTGAVLDELLAATRAADLMVLGAHGVNTLRDRIIGTTAERLLGRCRIPIVVARHEPNIAYRRLLVPVDLSAYSAPALAAAVRIAPGGEIHVLHVYDVPFEGKLWLSGVAEAVIERHRADVRAQALHQVYALIDAHLPGKPRTVVTVERGEAARTILDAASQFGADLVVVGKQGLSAIGDLFLGSVTRHVLADAECDVLVVPPPETASVSGAT